MEKLKLVYSIKSEEWMEGYDLYKKMFTRKFTYIKAAIFLIPLLLFVQQVWIDPTYTMGWICIVVCIGAIAAIFANPRLERKNTEHALEAVKDDKYEFTLYDDKFTVSTILPENESEYLDRDENGNAVPLPEIKPTEVSLKEKGLKIIETEKIFGFYTKAVSLTVPKSALNDRDTAILREMAEKVNRSAKSK